MPRKARTARASARQPTYVITGRFPDRPDDLADDDRLTAETIERARRGLDVQADEVAGAIASSDEAARALALGPPHVHPDDVAYATRVDCFDFAMEVHRRNGNLELRATGK